MSNVSCASACGSETDESAGPSSAGAVAVPQNSKGGQQLGPPDALLICRGGERLPVHISVLSSWSHILVRVCACMHEFTRKPGSRDLDLMPVH